MSVSIHSFPVHFAYLGTRQIRRPKKRAHVFSPHHLDIPIPPNTAWLAHLIISSLIMHFSVNTMLRHPGQSSGDASRLDGDSKDHPNIIMRLSDAISTAGTTQQRHAQALAAATLAPAQMDVSTTTAAVSEPKPIDHYVVLPEDDGAANVPIANRTHLSLFSPLHVLPAVAALVEPSPPTAAPGTSHIVTPTNDDPKLSAAPRLRHPGAPLLRRVSDSSSSSSNEDKLDLPTTDEPMIITTTINNKRGEDADDLVLVGETNTTVQEGGFCFHSDGSFSIVESPKTTAMKVSTGQGERGIVIISRPLDHNTYLFVGLVMQFTSTHTY